MTNDDHIKTIQQKVYGILNSIQPLKIILPNDIKLQLVKSLILPIFDYMDIIYHNFGSHGSNGNNDKLEKLQNMCIRFILNVDRNEHIIPHRETSNLMKLSDQRTLHSLIYKNLNNLAPAYLTNLIKINKSKFGKNKKWHVEKNNL